MSMKRPWYKRYPDHFIAGTVQLTFEETAAYSVLIDLTHASNGKLPDDDRRIAKVLKLHLNRWRRLKTSLEAHGKLRVNFGQIQIIPSLHEISPSQPIEIIESADENKNREEKKEKPTKERHPYGPRYNTQDSIREAFDAIDRRTAAGLDPFNSDEEGGAENIILLPGLRKGSG